MKHIAALLIVFFAAFTPAIAQEADAGDPGPLITLEAVAPAATVEPVVVDDTPAVPEDIALETINDLRAQVNLLASALMAVGLMAGIFALIILYLAKVISDAGAKASVNVIEIVKEVGKLYPAEAIDKFIESRKAGAAKTDDPKDDIVWTVADTIAEKVASILNAAPAPAEPDGPAPSVPAV